MPSACCLSGLALMGCSISRFGQWSSRSGQRNLRYQMVIDWNLLPLLSMVGQSSSPLTPPPDHHHCPIANIYRIHPMIIMLIRVAVVLHTLSFCRRRGRHHHDYQMPRLWKLPMGMYLHNIISIYCGLQDFVRPYDS